MKNTLAENMLRFGSKNLDPKSIQTLKRLAEQAGEGKKDSASFNTLMKTLAAGKNPYAWVSKITGLLYVPTAESKNKVLSVADPISYIAYGISPVTYKWKTTEAIDNYTFPKLVVRGNIDIKEGGGGAFVTGLEQTDPAVMIKPEIDTLTVKSMDELITSVKDNEAVTWNALGTVEPRLYVDNFIDVNKGKLQLNVTTLTMQNKITAAVFADKTNIQWAAYAINKMGGQV